MEKHKPALTRVLFIVKGKIKKLQYRFIIYFLTYIAIYCKSATFSEVQTSPPLSHFLDRNAFPDSTEHGLKSPTVAPKEVYDTELRTSFSDPN